MEIDKLSDHKAVLAVHFLAVRWLEKDGVAVQVALQDVQRRAAKRKVELPAWATKTMPPNKKNGAMCRNVLKAVSTGSDANAREWARGAIVRATGPTAHVVDPATLALAGMFLIGLVLASRVKRIKTGSAEIDFYEGVPKETVDIVEKAAGGLIKKP